MTDLCPKCSDSLERPECDRCSSKNIQRAGIIMNSNAQAKQRYRCNDCGRTFRVRLTKSYGKEYLTVFYSFPDALGYAEKNDGTLFVEVGYGRNPRTSRGMPMYAVLAIR